METSRAARRAERTPRAVELFGPNANAALDALELFELAWHDCYAEPSPPGQVIDDLWTVSDGELAQLIIAAHLAVTDARDLRLNADSRRNHG